jgi:hypothetical protein
VKLVLNAGLQKDGQSKKEEIRFCGCSYNSGKIVGITGFNTFGDELKVKKKFFQNSRFQRVKAGVKKTSKKRFKKACKSE